MKSYFLKHNKNAFFNDGVRYLAYAILIVVFILILAIIGIYTNGYGGLGELGSFLSGSIGVVVALLVGVFTFLAFYAQYQANEQIQKQFVIQQFENQFFKMVDLHNRNVSEFSIPYYDKITDTFTGKETTFPREIRGRACFVDMIKELQFILDKKFDKVPKILAYNIFFFGVHSDRIEDNSEKKYFKNFQDRYKANIEKWHKREPAIRYVPFQGHESRLAHYFRHLFQTVKYVVNAENEGIINYEEARQYLRVLRAQLSNSEQLLLYYNYISGFAPKWDQKGDSGYEFFTRYRMIHNIPIGQVKVVENPNEHFKVLKESWKVTDKDPLFDN